MLDTTILKGFNVEVYLGINNHITRIFTIAPNSDTAIQNVKNYLDKYVTYEYKIAKTYDFELKEGVVI